MPAFDQYAIYPEDRTLRLVQPMDIRTQSREVVRVGSRKFDELIRSGYRIQNPNNSAAHHRNTTLGLHHMATLVVPGYALANEVARHRINPEQVAPGVEYTPWAGVVAMRRRARDAGHPELVAVFAEGTANYAHERALADTSRGKIPSRFVIKAFVVSDKPRTTGYAPEKWIEEEADRAMEAEHARLADKSQAVVDKSKKIQDDFKAKVAQADINVRTKIMPQLEKLEKAVDKVEEVVEKKGPDSAAAKTATEQVKTVAREADRQFSLLKYASRKVKGAGKGFMRGWRGDDITWGPGVRGGRR